MTQATRALAGHGDLAAPGPPEIAVAGERRSPRLVARALFLLTKPRIIELLLVTTLPTMLLARRGLPGIGLIAVTLLGGALAAGSANTLNCYLDRDIDAIMKRTSRRPLVAKGAPAAVKPGEALASGILLGAAATVLLGLLANWLSAILADGAILFYVFVYTMGLKRRTASEHRHRWRGWLLPGAGRLGSGDRYRQLAGRSCCSASSSSGRRRTSGRWR